VKAIDEEEEIKKKLRLFIRKFCNISRIQEEKKKKEREGQLNQGRLIIHFVYKGSSIGNRKSSFN
jgi:hypothetical protein